MDAGCLGILGRRPGVSSKIDAKSEALSAFRSWVTLNLLMIW